MDKDTFKRSKLIIRYLEKTITTSTSKKQQGGNVEEIKKENTKYREEMKEIKLEN